MSGSKKSGPSKFQWSQEEAEKPERAVVIVPVFSRSAAEKAANASPSTRDVAARIDEAIGLTQAINLEVVLATSVQLKKTTPSTLFGKGKVAELGELIHDHDAGLAIVDHAISPVQQQNLEEAWQCKVLDRTGLILEIFGDRAQTKEGRLQVELAHLEYQKGRLVRQWTHLERQRGGAGFMGGPGETQIEADRREIQSKILGLKRELEKVRKTRTLHRAQRKKVPHPVVALVGYTNAGKSTLFNKLTGAGVMAKDQLFATLDPTMRQLELPLGTKAILSDTVGFVSNLPTHLVAAFRATLEEVIEADVILHVRDIADPDTAAQCKDVLTILDQLGIGEQETDRIIEVWNKIDLLDTETLNILGKTRLDNEGPQTPLMVSAVKGTGVDELLNSVEKKLTTTEEVRNIHLALNNLDKLGWIYEHTTVLERDANEDGSLNLTVRAKSEIFKGLVIRS